MLARPEYEPLRPSLTERALNLIAEQVARVLAAVTGTGAGSVFAALVLLAAVAAVLALVVRYGRGVRRDPALAAPFDGQVGRNAADWLADAEASEAAGRWRDGVRCRYRALVAGLAERGLVEEVPGRTSGEYRSAVEEALPAGSAAFARATAVFEAVWYGHAPATREIAAALARAADQVRAAADGRLSGART